MAKSMAINPFSPALQVEVESKRKTSAGAGVAVGALLENN